MKSSAPWISWGLVKQNTFMFTNSQMLCTFRYPWILAQQQQEQHPVWGAALSVMSDNEKINHLLERAGPLCLSLEEVELQWSIKRTLESTGGSALSVLSLCMWLETGKEILLHPGHATKESWDQATTQRRVERNQYHYWQCKSMCVEKASQWMEPDGFSLRSRGAAL